VDVDRSLTRLDDERTARQLMWVVWPLGLAVIAHFGRDQWFIADDWAFLLAREHMRVSSGLDAMLLTPQDGHWMMGPLLVFRLLRAVFGIDSYAPYLVVLWITHFGVVALTRMVMIRLGSTQWTATLMSALLLLFGGGWENIFFAVQIVYTFSLLAFLAQLLLVDHDGPLDRRDSIGAAISLIGVSSSGFGPFFAFGVGLLLALRRRWQAAAVAVVPQALLLGWWWLTWGDDPAGDRTGTAGPEFIARFTIEGLASTLGSLMGTRLLAGAAGILIVAMIVWARTTAGSRQMMITLLATSLVMYAGIGARREVFGEIAATWSRYQYMAAMLVAPILAVGLDQARHFAPWARWVTRAALVLVLVRNVQWMDQRSGAWAEQSNVDRRVMSLVVGSDGFAGLPIIQSISLDSPEVRVGDVPYLIDQGAIEPVPPGNDLERRIVDDVVSSP
jgi:hypothetical protein